jgi:putative toxin-antitoxin system antitoxin component (TIGR02293 family)
VASRVGHRGEGAEKLGAGTPKHKRSRMAPLVPEVELVQKALDVIGSPERVTRWMQTPLGALRGRTPYSLLGSEEGRKKVDTVLGRIEHGIY